MTGHADRLYLQPRLRRIAPHVIVLLRGAATIGAPARGGRGEPTASDSPIDRLPRAVSTADLGIWPHRTRCPHRQQSVTSTSSSRWPPQWAAPVVGQVGVKAIMGPRGPGPAWRRRDMDSTPGTGAAPRPGPRGPPPAPPATSASGATGRRHTPRP